MGGGGGETGLGLIALGCGDTCGLSSLGGEVGGGCWPLPGKKGEGVESQNLLCLDRLVTVEKAWPHFWHLICILQLACILLCLHRLENWV